MAPRDELPGGADEAPLGGPATESLTPLDRPYVATVTCRAVASAEVDGFDLLVIYPRAAGDFVGHRTGVECRKTGDGTLFADDHEDGRLQLLVASPRTLTFPLDIVCRFTVEPHASLPARLIAVSVVEVSTGSTRADPSALTIAVGARSPSRCGVTACLLHSTSGRH